MKQRIVLICLAATLLLSCVPVYAADTTNSLSDFFGSLNIRKITDFVDSELKGITGFFSSLKEYRNEPERTIEAPASEALAQASGEFLSEAYCIIESQFTALMNMMPDRPYLSY